MSSLKHSRQIVLSLTIIALLFSTLFISGMTALRAQLLEMQNTRLP